MLLGSSLGALLGWVLGSSLGALLGWVLGVLLGSLDESLVRVLEVRYICPIPCPITKEIVTDEMPLTSTGALHSTMRSAVPVPLLSTIITLVPAHPVFGEYPVPDTEPAVACITPLAALTPSKMNVTALPAVNVVALWD